MRMYPKYSIIIPTYNAIEYLPTCIETILSQKYDDYELIISDDHSSDGTRSYLESLSHPNIITLFSPKSLSMTEHWEWALGHAKGEWLIFVGQDDGLQSYFFKLADELTRKAKKCNLRTIMSLRAYYFWKGCEQTYGDITLSYTAYNKSEIKAFNPQVFKILLGLQDYFTLPQMYTTSLFHRDLLTQVRARQNGKVFLTHPQDANLAAIACRLEEKYLHSNIPLGWVGTSPKSAGMAITTHESDHHKDNIESIKTLKKVYQTKISKSKLVYHPLAGDFSFGNNIIYFWQALLSTTTLKKLDYEHLLTSKLFKVIMFSVILNQILRTLKKPSLLEEFKNIIHLNKCSYLLIQVSEKFLVVILAIRSFSLLPYRGIKKLYYFISKKRVIIRELRSVKQDASMVQGSKRIQMYLLQKKWLNYVE